VERPCGRATPSGRDAGDVPLPGLPGTGSGAGLITASGTGEGRRLEALGDGLAEAVGVAEAVAVGEPVGAADAVGVAETAGVPPPVKFEEDAAPRLEGVNCIFSL
jgi:hypothetical protein